MLTIIFLAPAWLFTIFIAIATVIGLSEIGSMSTRGRSGLVVLLVVIGAIPAFVLLETGDWGWAAPAIVMAAMLALVVRVGIYGAEGGGSPTLLTSVGAPYVGVLFPYFALLRNGPNGIRLVVLMLLLVVAGDSAAYFVGTRLGRIKLIPRVSPGKTVEGAVGSIAASLAVMALLRNPMAPGLGWGAAMLFALEVNVLSQIGDLAESAFKRLAGVKDSGRLFPGHGGLLDRADSLVFAAVFTYYCLR